MNSTEETFAKFALGFFGTIFGFFLLPKALKYFVRTFIVNVVAEIVTVVLTGLLTEKAAELLTGSR